MSYLQSPTQPDVMRRPDLPPLPVPRAQQERRDVVADLIQRATASEVPRLVKAADRIQDLVDQLEKDVAEHELSAELRAEAERLEARLAEIRGQIGGKRAASPASRKTHDNRAIREWAASAGIECPARGRIPRSVVEAFEGVNR